MEKIRIGGVIVHQNLACIQVRGYYDEAFTLELLRGFARQKINIQFIVQLLGVNYEEQLIMAVDFPDIHSAFEQVCLLQRDSLIERFSIYLDCALVGIYGPDFRFRPGIAAMFLQALHDKEILIKAISTSISTCATIISAKEVEKALQAIESTFDVSTNKGMY